jgi:2-desacetyl-2-hydroxyethyl bacteriochlorophyllide A dehydrogenase
MYYGSPGSVEVTSPVVFGHELSGEVAEIGARVEGSAVGDRVTVDPNMPCGTCLYCRNGSSHLCRSLQAVGVTRDGGFAEYCTVPAAQLYKVGRSVSFESASLAEPLACCLHGIERAGIQAGQTVAVVGSGPIGLIMVQLAFRHGASRVFASDPRASRRDMARRFGAEVLDPGKDTIAAALQRQGSEGVDTAIECAGAPDAMGQAIASVKRGGTVLLFSVPDVEASLQVRPFDIYQKELTIKGSFINPNTHGRAVTLIGQGMVELEALISHRFALADLGKALAMHSNPQSVKILVEP